MGIFRLNYRSEILGRYVDITVAYPTDSYRCPTSSDDQSDRIHAHISTKEFFYQPGMLFQTIYLIHGGGDDDTLTYRYSNIEEYAQRNHVMLVTPNVANSFGIDTMYTVPYMRFLTEELPTIIQSLFASSPVREDNFIMGYAMGGNVALGCAVNRPDLYHSCVDISGGIGMTFRSDILIDELNGDHFRSHFPLYNASFGPTAKILNSKVDLKAQVLCHRAVGDPECNFILICGSREFIRFRIENDVAEMQALNMNIRYICAEDYDHNFILWDRYMQLALDRFLPLKRHAIYPNRKE